VFVWQCLSHDFVFVWSRHENSAKVGRCALQGETAHRN
jgi:hypothetical protein